jgi:hypothetical protein
MKKAWQFINCIMCRVPGAQQDPPLNTRQETAPSSPPTANKVILLPQSQINFLKCLMFSCSLDVFYGGGLGKVHGIFCFKKDIKNFLLYFFLQFPKPGSRLDSDPDSFEMPDLNSYPDPQHFCLEQNKKFVFSC